MGKTNSPDVAVTSGENGGEKEGAFIVNSVYLADGVIASLGFELPVNW